MVRTLLVSLVIAFGACSSDKAAAPASGSAASGATASGAAGPLLRVDAYCGAFCSKLCGTCGDAACADTCTPRCYHGRAPDSVLDGKDPKVALALTATELDACLKTITAESCPSIMQGQVPPACFTIQH
jgi:hypothetical protein